MIVLDLADHGERELTGGGGHEIDGLTATSGRINQVGWFDVHF
jgi:hypothetical protein